MVLAISGPRRVGHAADERRNVGEIERLLSIAGGSALAISGLRRRGLGGIGLALLGAELVRRGATGRCLLYEALGVSTADDGSHAGSTHRSPDDLAGAAATVNAREAVKIERQLFVDRPRAELYSFWSDFRNHPRFMRHLRSVDVRDGRSHWVMSIAGGRVLEWDSVVVNDIPNELIAWKTVGDSAVAHAGSVHFSDAPGGGTHVRLVMDYEPPGGRPGYALARLLGLSAGQLLDDDLERFKELMEQEGLRHAGAR